MKNIIEPFRIKVVGPIRVTTSARHESLRGLEIVEQPPTLRHFTARFRETW